jgi:hypothetical protein
MTFCSCEAGPGQGPGRGVAAGVREGGEAVREGGEAQGEGTQIGHVWVHGRQRRWVRSAGLVAVWPRSRNWEVQACIGDARIGGGA